jgi:uncharacterized membrane protein
MPFGRRGPSRLQKLVAVGSTAAAIVPLAEQAVHAVGKARELSSGARQAKDRIQQIEEAVSSHSSTVGKAASLLNTARKGGKDKPKLSHLIEEHTDIGLPRSTVYNQWTQLELFPSIVKGVDAVDQDEDDRAVWTSKIGPVRRVWKARIAEQVTDEKIAWRSESGPEHEGVVTFHSLSPDLTRVLIQMHYKPHGPLETIANELRIQRRRVRRDLRMFKHFLELRGEESGSWRGQIGSGESGQSGETSRPRKAAAKRSGRPPSRSSGGRSTSGSAQSANGSARSTGGSARANNGRARATNGTARASSGAKKAGRTRKESAR